MNTTKRMTKEAGGPEPGIVIPVLEAEQPLGTFYVGVMKASDLRSIAAADVRRKVARELDSYTGIQRELNKQREAEISQYISTVDAAFPNSFIVAVRSEDVIDQSDQSITLRSDERVASIIDGQHRLAGFTEESGRNFSVIVSIFIDLPIEDQAMLFATINLKQTKVSPSLVYDLYEETKLRSPQKTCHNIAKLVNNDERSAFFHRIKPLGKRTPEFNGTLTQATFVKRLLPLVCSNPDEIRDEIKRGRPVKVDDPANSTCPFWPYFVEDKDWAILKIMNNYFGSVSEVFSKEWRSSESPLARTIGFAALMRLLPQLVRDGKKGGSLDAQFFASKIGRAKALAPFTFDEFPASGAGETKLFRAIESEIYAEHTG